MTMTYTEGFDKTWRHVLGPLFLLLLGLFGFWLYVGPVARFLAGTGPTVDDAFVAVVFLIAILAEVVAVRILGKAGVPIRIESGTVFFPRSGVWNVLLGRTVPLSTSEIEEVEVVWPLLPVRNGGKIPYVYKIVVRTLDGRSYLKMYRPYSGRQQAWARDTAAQLQAALGTKLRHLDYHSGKSLVWQA